MAITTVKTTYSLDVNTVAALDEIARAWGVSKSEALRRAIRAAAQSEPLSKPDPIQALQSLQGALRLSPAKAEAWIARTRRERRAAGTRLIRGLAR
jgi:hypothetical protein